MNRSKMDCHALTDVGKSRADNEDHFLIADLVKAVRIQSTSLSYDDQAEVSGQSHGKLMLVADGMGGHAAGRRASTLAVDETINYMVNRMQWFSFSKISSGEDDSEPLAADLIRALNYCQDRIQNEAHWNPERKGMGTTLTVAIIDWPSLHVVHVGDSRCYLDRGDQLQQLTRDHTLANAVADARESSEAIGEDSPLNNTLWNVVGGPTTDLVPEVYTAQLEIGDTLLLCTDGLTKHVTDGAIAKELRKPQTAKQACGELVRQANDAGGSDNITVMVARFAESGSSSKAAEVETGITADSAESAHPSITGGDLALEQPSSAESPGTKAP